MQKPCASRLVYVGVSVVFTASLFGCTNEVSKPAVGNKAELQNADRVVRGEHRLRFSWTEEQKAALFDPQRHTLQFGEGAVNSPSYEFVLEGIESFEANSFSARAQVLPFDESTRYFLVEITRKNRLNLEGTLYVGVDAASHELDFAEIEESSSDPRKFGEYDWDEGQFPPRAVIGISSGFETNGTEATGSAELLDWITEGIPIQWRYVPPGCR